jgi:low affinity Fe/Cu permease
VEKSTNQQRVSRVLHWVGELTSRSAAAAVIVSLLVVFGVLLAILGFPGTWEMAFSTVVGAITLVMLFVIQHTQSRHQIVLQLKLDELIRTSPHADDLLVHLEVADDAELIEIEKNQVAHHEAVREGDELEHTEHQPHE